MTLQSPTTVEDWKAAYRGERVSAQTPSVPALGGMRDLTVGVRDTQFWSDRTARPRKEAPPARAARYGSNPEAGRDSRSYESSEAEPYQRPTAPLPPPQAYIRSGSGQYGRRGAKASEAAPDPTSNVTQSVGQQPVISKVERWRKTLPSGEANSIPLSNLSAANSSRRSDPDASQPTAASIHGRSIPAASQLSEHASDASSSVVQLTFEVFEQASARARQESGKDAAHANDTADTRKDGSKTLDWYQKDFARNLEERLQAIAPPQADDSGSSIVSLHRPPSSVGRYQKQPKSSWSHILPSFSTSFQRSLGLRALQAYTSDEELPAFDGSSEAGSTSEARFLSHPAVTGAGKSQRTRHRRDFSDITDELRVPPSAAVVADSPSTKQPRRKPEQVIRTRYGTAEHTRADRLPFEPAYHLEKQKITAVDPTGQGPPADYFELSRSPSPPRQITTSLGRHVHGVDQRKGGSGKQPYDFEVSPQTRRELADAHNEFRNIVSERESGVSRTKGRDDAPVRPPMARWDSLQIHAARRGKKLAEGNVPTSSRGLQIPTVTVTADSDSEPPTPDLASKSSIPPVNTPLPQEVAKKVRFKSPSLSSGAPTNSPESHGSQHSGSSDSDDSPPQTFVSAAQHRSTPRPTSSGDFIETQKALRRINVEHHEALRDSVQQLGLQTGAKAAGEQAEESEESKNTLHSILKKSPATPSAPWGESSAYHPLGGHSGNDTHAAACAPEDRLADGSHTKRAGLPSVPTVSQQVPYFPGQWLANSIVLCRKCSVYKRLRTLAWDYEADLEDANAKRIKYWEPFIARFEALLSSMREALVRECFMGYMKEFHAVLFGEYGLVAMKSMVKSQIQTVAEWTGQAYEQAIEILSTSDEAINQTISPMPLPTAQAFSAVSASILCGGQYFQDLLADLDYLTSAVGEMLLILQRTPNKAELDSMPKTDAEKIRATMTDQVHWLDETLLEVRQWRRKVSYAGFERQLGPLRNLDREWTDPSDMDAIFGMLRILSCCGLCLPKEVRDQEAERKKEEMLEAMTQRRKSEEEGQAGGRLSRSSSVGGGRRHHGEDYFLDEKRIAKENQRIRKRSS